MKISIFRETPAGRLSSDIDDWSVEKIKRMGGDAVKALVWYRPDAHRNVIRLQQDYVRRVGEECARFDIPFLLELLVYPLLGEDGQTKDYVEQPGKKAEHVLASVEEFAKADYRVDVFKLESPVPADEADGSDAVQRLFDEMGRLAGRPWVMLSAGAGKEAFARVLEHAFRAGASGFLAGRAIWADAFAAYPDWAKVEAGLRGEALDYLSGIGAMADRAAAPWHLHPCWGEGGSRFDPPTRASAIATRGSDEDRHPPPRSPDLRRPLRRGAAGRDARHSRPNGAPDRGASRAPLRTSIQRRPRFRICARPGSTAS